MRNKSSGEVLSIAPIFFSRALYPPFVSHSSITSSFQFHCSFRRLSLLSLLLISILTLLFLLSYRHCLSSYSDLGIDNSHKEHMFISTTRCSAFSKQAIYLSSGIAACSFHSQGSPRSSRLSSSRPTVLDVHTAPVFILLTTQ